MRLRKKGFLRILVICSVAICAACSIGKREVYMGGESVGGSEWFLYSCEGFVTETDEETYSATVRIESSNTTNMGIDAGLEVSFSFSSRGLKNDFGELNRGDFVHIEFFNHTNPLGSYEVKAFSR